MDSTPSPTPEQLQQQIAEMQQVIKSLISQLPLPNPNPPPQITTPTKGLKVAPPDVFDGTTSKTDAFLSQLALFFQGKRNEVQDDQDKIVLTLSYMKGGTAGPWAKEKVKQYSGAEKVSQDWPAFLDEFKETFGDPDPASTARHNMDQLRQSTHTADEYVSSFRELKDDTGYNDAALVEKFEKGLNQALVDKIYALAEMPKNLKEWISWSTKLDRQWRQREVKKKTAGTFPIPKQSKNFTPFNTPLKPAAPVRDTDVIPMEVDSSKKKFGPIICYKCRKPGHIARNCKSTVDINSMDFDALKAYMKDQLQQDSKRAEDFWKVHWWKACPSGPIDFMYFRT